MRVLALVASAADRARLRTALATCVQISFAESPDELWRGAVSGRVDALIAESTGLCSGSTEGLIRRLHDGFPELPILLYCDPYASDRIDLVAVVQAGVAELIFRGIDEARVPLERAIAKARGTSVVERIYARLAPRLTDGARPIIRSLLQHSGEQLAVTQVALALGVHRRTLVNRTAAANLPAPSVVGAWCRLLVSVELLRTPGKSLNQVARELHFPSPVALRNMFKRYTGLTASALRGDAGVRTLDTLFLHAIGVRDALLCTCRDADPTLPRLAPADVVPIRGDGVRLTPSPSPRAPAPHSAPTETRP